MPDEDDQPTKLGRPTKCTPALVAKVKRLLEEGAYPDTVCGILNVSMDSYRRWLKQGEEDLEAGRDTTFATFAATVESSVARSQGYAARMQARLEFAQRKHLSMIPALEAYQAYLLTP